MANEYLTLLDLAKSIGSDKEVGLIETVVLANPEMQFFPMRTIPGTAFKTVLRTALPSPGFRNVNTGVETKKSSYASKMVECFYFDGQMEMDVAVAEADDQGIDHALNMEAEGMMMGTLRQIGRQVWYGTDTTYSGDANGFPGAVSVYDTTYSVDAGGTTATTGSSVWAVKAGPQYVTLIGGRSKTLSMGEWRKQFITRNSTSMEAYKASLSGFIGCQFVNPLSLGRIYKLTEETGKGLTDSLVAQLLAKFPVGIVPDALFMTRRSRRQLQMSRSTTTVNNTNGVPKTGRSYEVTAPIPTESQGIPIIVTDNLSDVEALTL